MKQITSRALYYSSITGNCEQEKTPEKELGI